MPSTSPKQARTMAAAAHDPKFRKKIGIPQKVAEEFNEADKGTNTLSTAMKGNKPKANTFASKDQIDTTTKKKVFGKKPTGNQFGLKKEKHYGR